MTSPPRCKRRFESGLEVRASPTFLIAALVSATRYFLSMGFALPGSLIVGADSHSCTYGAFGAFGTGVGATDMAEIYSRGRLWFKVPETIGIEITGKLKPYVSAKDLALKIIGDLGADGATYKAIEYFGLIIEEMSISGRMTLCNMGVEMGAKAAIVPPDEKTDAYLKRRAKGEYRHVLSDPGSYDSELVYDVTDLEPQIAFPCRVDNVRPVSELDGHEDRSGVHRHLHKWQA